MTFEFQDTDFFWHFSTRITASHATDNNINKTFIDHLFVTIVLQIYRYSDEMKKTCLKLSSLTACHYLSNRNSINKQK